MQSGAACVASIEMGFPCTCSVQSANLANLAITECPADFANGTINLKIFLKHCFLSVKHLQFYLTPYFYSNQTKVSASLEFAGVHFTIAFNVTGYIIIALLRLLFLYSS